MKINFTIIPSLQVIGLFWTLVTEIGAGGRLQLYHYKLWRRLQLYHYELWRHFSSSPCLPPDNIYEESLK
jgi:hypothetical protein